jgi:WD40 repeat protein
MRIFNTTSGKCTAIFDGHAEDASVYSVAFSPCNGYVASAGGDGCIQLKRCK